MTLLAQNVRYDSLKDAVVVVTGGASGIGRGIVTAFAAQGRGWHFWTATVRVLR